jgi:hypothetical protein
LRIEKCKKGAQFCIPRLVLNQFHVVSFASSEDPYHFILYRDAQSIRQALLSRVTAQKKLVQ